jgi:hypothetical protein
MPCRRRLLDMNSCGVWARWPLQAGLEARSCRFCPPLQNGSAADEAKRWEGLGAREFLDRSAFALEAADKTCFTDCRCGGQASGGEE